jgi:hypothetical protein
MEKNLQLKKLFSKSNGWRSRKAATWRKKVENRAALEEMHEIDDDKSPIRSA